MKKNKASAPKAHPIRIPMPVRYVINLVLIVATWFLFTSLISAGVISNYWTGILIMVGINIILAVSLNIATGYLRSAPAGARGLYGRWCLCRRYLHEGCTDGGAAEGREHGRDHSVHPDRAAHQRGRCRIFGIIIGIPALRLRGDYLAIITLGFGEIIRVVLTNIDSILGFDFTYGAAGLKAHPEIFLVHARFSSALSCRASSSTRSRNPATAARSSRSGR